MWEEVGERDRERERKGRARNRVERIRGRERDIMKNGKKRSSK